MKYAKGVELVFYRAAEIAAELEFKLRTLKPENEKSQKEVSKLGVSLGYELSKIGIEPVVVSDKRIFDNKLYRKEDFICHLTTGIRYNSISDAEANRLGFMSTGFRELKESKQVSDCGEWAKIKQGVSFHE